MVRIALISEQTGFVDRVLRQFATGFCKRGIPAAHYTGPINFEILVPWLKDNDIALCLHYGGILPHSILWPDDISHVAWIVDYRQHGQDIIGDLGASNHLYFIMHPQVYGLIEPLRNRSWSMLLPGARDNIPLRYFHPDNDFCMAGYIPLPLIYTSPVGKRTDGSIVTLEQFLRVFPQRLLHMATLSIGAIRTAVTDCLAELKCEPFNLNNTMQVFDDILVRTTDRTAILDQVIQWGANLRIYGPETWERWPQFAPYYRGMLTLEELDIQMQLAKINIHNGCLAFHYRVADAMAAGAFIMVNRTDVDSLVGGIATILEPDVDYTSYSVDNFADAAKEYLEDHNRRNKVTANGHRAVLARHTWAHRADQVIRDFGLGIRPVERADMEAKRISTSLRSHLAEPQLVRNS